VYIREQVPHYYDDTTFFIDTQDGSPSREPYLVSLRRERKSVALAFMENEESFIVMACSTPSRRITNFLRAYSGISAFLITFGYLCQYIVVRRSTRTESLIWLLFQSGLTVLRVLVWIFPSKLLPLCLRRGHTIHTQAPYSFSDLRASSGRLKGARFMDYRILTELELVVTYASAYSCLIQY
jgi:hypothetical protein